MTETQESINQNQYGVDLRAVKPGTSWPVELNFDRMTATVLDRNLTADEFHIRINTPFDIVEETVSGAAFRPPKDRIRNAISEDEFVEIEEGDKVVFWAHGHEQTAGGWVDEINREDGEVYISGECNAQTLSRWVSRELISSVRKPTEE